MTKTKKKRKLHQNQNKKYIKKNATMSDGMRPFLFLAVYIVVAYMRVCVCDASALFHMLKSMKRTPTKEDEVIHKR